MLADVRPHFKHNFSVTVNHTLLPIMKNFKTTLVIFTLLTFVLWGCDDDPTGPDPDDAPDTPTLENVGMDLSIFDAATNTSQADFEDPQALVEEIRTMNEINEQLSAYEQAAIFAVTAEFWFQAMGQLPNAFFQQHQWGEPELDGDTWVWEWSYQVEGESASFIITADEVDNERHWEMRVTVEGTDEDDVNNALFIASQVDLNGQYGSWQMFDFDDDLEPVPAFEVDYQLDGDITTSLEMRFAEESEDGVMSYNRDGTTSSLEYFDLVDDGESLIMWNNEEGYGFIESPGYSDGSRSCWNSELEGAECDEIPAL